MPYKVLVRWLLDAVAGYGSEDKSAGSGFLFFHGQADEINNRLKTISTGHGLPL
jgi:hypothetical protein